MRHPRRPKAMRRRWLRSRAVVRRAGLAVVGRKVGPRLQARLDHLRQARGACRGASPPRGNTHTSCARPRRPRRCIAPDGREPGSRRKRPAGRTPASRPPGPWQSPSVPICRVGPNSTPVCWRTQKRKPASSVLCWRGENGPQGRAPSPSRSPARGRHHGDHRLVAAHGQDRRIETDADRLGRPRSRQGRPCRDRALHVARRRIHESLDQNQGIRASGRSWQFSGGGAPSPSPTEEWEEDSAVLPLRRAPSPGPSWG